MKKDVQKAKTIIETHYKKIKSVEDIAAKLDCNYGTLRAVFVRETGLTLIAYLNRTRCMYAAVLLKTTNWKLYVVALEVGFTHEKYFLKVFKKFCGKCPEQYRKETNR